MLNDEEMKNFVALLKEFMMNAGLSMAATGELFGVSSAALTRWCKYAEGAKGRASRWMATPIATKILKMNAFDVQNQVYLRLTGAKQHHRVTLLREVLQANTTWA